jgi:hypothetical protein
MKFLYKLLVLRRLAGEGACYKLLLGTSNDAEEV